MFCFDKNTLKSFTKNILVVVIVLTLILTVASCKPVDSKDNSNEAAKQDSSELALDEQTQESEDNPTEEPEKPKLSKQLIYVSIMGGRDCSIPIEEKGFDYNNFDLIIELDPNDSTIKVVDIAWLMGMAVSEDETIANMMMGDRFGPAALPEEVARIFDLTFTYTVIVNFSGVIDFFDGMNGVDAEISAEVIEDGSYNDAVDNLQYFAPGATADKLDSPGEKKLTGAQVLAMIFTTPKRVADTPGGTEPAVRALNAFIDGMSKLWVLDFTEKIKDMSTDDMVGVLKQMTPNMYSSFSEDEYSELADIISMCLDNDAQVIRMPDEADGYVLEENEFSAVMILDIEKARQKLKDFFAD